MNQLSNINVLCGELPKNIKPLVPFSPIILDFLSDLSQSLLKHPLAKQYPDIITFAYFIRPANLHPYALLFKSKENCIGKGLVFHIAPSNVAMNFAYSLVTALLSGNHSIVKAPSKKFIQVDILCESIKHLLKDKYNTLNNYIFIVTYDRIETKNTKYFSEICDVRIIWGGDTSVSEIRKHPLSPRAIDIPFSDRYSLSIIDASYILTLDQNELYKMAKSFYNDTFLNDQNACSSPRLIYWLDTNNYSNDARKLFWEAVKKYAEKYYDLQPVVNVDKYNSALSLAIENNNIEIDDIGLITRIELKELSSNIQKVTQPGGFFLEYIDNNLQALSSIINKKTQTITYLGIQPKDISDFIINNSLQGVDRIVPFGQSMAFSFRWDGFDLLNLLSREINY